MTKIGFVVESSQNNIMVEVNEYKLFEDNKLSLQIGKYLKIADGNDNYVIASILNIKVVDKSDGEPSIRIIISTQPLGTLIDNNFNRGSMVLPVPMEPVYVVDHETLNMVFNSDDNYSFPFGKLVQNNAVELKINGDNFFGKHVGIVGTTGSGKSCAVSTIIQNVVGINNASNIWREKQKNSHIIIFDLHSEYSTAFTLGAEQNFTLNKLNIDSLKLPYWLLNSEELQEMFIESKEQNSHNQISQFKNAVILNKEKHNPTINEITYDTPVYFSIKEVCNYLENLNNEVIGKKEGENKPKLDDGTLIEDRNEYFNQVYDFVPNSTSKDTKASNGPFNGDFDRFIFRLDTKLKDKRLNFLLDPIKSDGTPYKSGDFEEIMKQFLGYLNKSNITVIDLSGIPFEVLSITVSLVSRLVFDFCFHYSKIRHSENQLNDIPFMIVCEEAHNYIPKEGGSEYYSSKKSIERIAKEGRKYGLSLMVVSQRPSEVSTTVFAQCNNFVALRLTNVNDQNYVKNLLPDNISSAADILPSLGLGEALVVGDAVLMPSVVKLEKPNPEPSSQTVRFDKEWKEDWKDIAFENVLKRWKNE